MDKLKLDDENIPDVYANILTLVRKNKELELEYRINFNDSMVLNILKHMRNKWYNRCELEQSVNLIYKSKNGSVIKKYVFNGLKTKLEIYRKRNLMNCIDKRYTNVKLSLSEESPCTEDEANVLTRVRIKNRLMIKDDPYRYDFTQTISMTATEVEVNKSLIKSNRTYLFSSLSGKSGKDLYDAFINNTVSMMKFEFEIEIQPRTHEDIDFLSIINRIDILGDMMRTSYYVDKIAKYTKNGSKSIKQALSKVVSLSKSTYNSEIYPPVGWYITHKADGDRGVLILSDTNILITSEYTVKVDIEYKGEETILDCEYVKPDILIFDAIKVNGESVVDKTLSERLKAIELLNIGLEIKKYFVLEQDLLESFKSVINYKFKYPSDGYILSSNNAGYLNTKHYKIKTEHTIDFLAIKLPASLKNNKSYPPKNDHQLYILFNGINGYEFERLGMYRLEGYESFFPSNTDVPKHLRATPEYMPIQFSPADRPKSYMWYCPNKIDKELEKYRGKSIYPERKNWVIVELNPIFKKNSFEWEFIRVREDRINEPSFYGNNFTTAAERNWLIAQDNIKIEDMHLTVGSYFDVRKDTMYHAQTSTLSFGKSSLIEYAKTMCKNKFVVDLSAGKGQDLHRYMMAGFNKGLFIDIDRTALSTLISKRYDLMKRRETKDIKFKTYITVQDLTENVDVIFDNIKQFIEFDKPSFVNCNLAMHYLIYDTAHLINFITLVKRIIEKDGIFIYTAFNGEKIVDLLKDKDEWVAHEDEVVKFHIKKLYKTDKLTGFGQMISVKLPFSGNVMYEESLIDHIVVNRNFENAGFKHLKTGSMGEFTDQFKDVNRKIFNKLTDHDKMYIDLYNYHVFRA